uniref:Uncharacterized protein n=1 Tax=Lygus hesperus TaxID=30085 RepID=A0A0K8S9M7_LYGHE
MEDFYNKVRQELEKQIKFSDEYKKNTENTFKMCYERVKSAIEEEKNVDSELEEALQECKNSSGLKERYEYELQEKYSNLELIEKEVGVLKNRVHACKEELNAILVGNKKLNDEVANTRAAHSREQSEKQALVEGLEKEIADKTSDLEEKEMKLGEAMQENKYLSEEVEKALNQIRVTSMDVGELNGQIDELNKKIAEGKCTLKELEDQVFELSGVHKEEERISTRKGVVLEKLAAKNSIATELENKLRKLQDEWAQANTKREELKSAEEEMKRRNESAKKDVNELLGTLSEMKEGGNTKELEQELSELKSKSQVLKKENDEAKNRLKSASVEIAELKDGNAALDQELKEATIREELAAKKFEYFQNERVRLEEMKSKISLVKEEVLKMKTSREFSVNVEHLREEVQKVQREIVQKQQQNEAQKESIQESFKKTLRSLQEQMEKLKEASEEEMRKRRMQTDRLHKTVPQLQKEIQTEPAASNNLPKLEVFYAPYLIRLPCVFVLFISLLNHYEVPDVSVQITLLLRAELIKPSVEKVENSDPAFDQPRSS